MPFAGYKDFDDCVRRNRDKDDPKAYCARIMQRTENKGAESQDVAETPPRQHTGWWKGHL